MASLLALAAAGMAEAGTLSRDGNILHYDADPGEANRVFVSTDSDGVHVIDTGAIVTPGAGCTAPGPNEGFCAATVKKQASLRLELTAGDEDDYVNVLPGTLGSAIVDGGAGDDELIGSGGFFKFFWFDGGAGADTFEGAVTVNYSDRTNPLTVTIGDDLPNDGEAGEGDMVSSETVGVDGGEGDDTMTVLDSEAVQQRARLEGDEGADTLSILRYPYGGYILGGTGPDVIHQEAKVGLVYGANGDDLIFGGDGHQALEGGGGDDILRGEDGSDYLSGNRGADQFLPGPGRDYAAGGHGPDTFYARDGRRDRLNGGPGKEDRARIDRALDTLFYVEELF